jgi:dihydrofolate reductase
MSMSLDGFIAGPNAGPGNGLGDGGQRLHDWPLTRADTDEMEVVRTGVNGQVFAELMSTGAVVAGRGTFEPAGGWRGDHHESVPIFILYRQKPGIDISHWPLVTPVHDITTAMAQAKGAAGDKNVLVHGAGIARLALAAGVPARRESISGRRLLPGQTAMLLVIRRSPTSSSARSRR